PRRPPRPTLFPTRRSSDLDHPKVQAFHRELLGRVRAANAGLGALLALGATARRLAANVAPAGLTVVNVAGYGEPGWQASWQAALDRKSTRLNSSHGSSTYA